MTNTEFSLEALTQATQVRTQMAIALQQMAQTLQSAETTGATASGKLGLERDIQSLTTASQQLEQGVFRLMVLGDMKRGKSTLINALLGEKVLPSDVNPCTALLTVLKYGPQKQVTVHFNDGRSPQVLDVPMFQSIYTIPADEAKHFEDQQETAFPLVSHAVVEYPLALLETGIEIIDTPGLNDTETRNQTVFEYLYTCHAVLFVLNAAQPCTLDERRYLQNYLKDRGLTLFFLINGWDRIRNSLVDPDDAEALQQAEAKLQQVFQIHLAEYCQVEDQNLYGKRVFPVSALEALRKRLNDPQGDLAGTGFPQFLNQLTDFLGQDRLNAELAWAERTAQRAYTQVSEAIARRIPLLDSNATELKAKIDSVEKEFEQLAAIRDQYQALIRQAGKHEAQEVANEFKKYILNLEATFETDFVASQPDLSLVEFLEQGNRDRFFDAFKTAFRRYLNDRLAAWELLAKERIRIAFENLNTQADAYRLDYEQVVEAINRKLIGSQAELTSQFHKTPKVLPWADVIQDLFMGIPDTLNRASTPFNMFWQWIFQIVIAYILIAVGLHVVSLFLMGLAFNILAVFLGGVGIITAQAEVVRQIFLNTTKKEFAKVLPKVAEEQQPFIARSVQRCFETYEAQIIERINADIESRHVELVNLLNQKATYHVNREAEVERLTQVEAQMVSTLQHLSTLQPIATVQAEE